MLLLLSELSLDYYVRYYLIVLRCFVQCGVVAETDLDAGRVGGHAAALR
jgi:hypothetical protein